MSAHRHALHFQRPLSPLADAQRHVKAVHLRNPFRMAIAIVGMALLGVLAIVLLFQATAAR